MRKVTGLYVCNIIASVSVKQLFPFRICCETGVLPSFFIFKMNPQFAQRSQSYPTNLLHVGTHSEGEESSKTPHVPLKTVTHSLNQLELLPQSNCRFAYRANHAHDGPRPLRHTPTALAVSNVTSRTHYGLG